MCRPHCWQYENPSGVCVPHRGHAIVLPTARAGGPAIPVGISAGDIAATGDGDGGIDGGTVGSGASRPMPGTPPIGPYAGSPAGAGKPPIGPGGTPAIAASGCPGLVTGVPNAGEPLLVCGSALPQLRQNFMPGGFSPRQTTHTGFAGNPCGEDGVCAKACAPAPEARELPQFRQNDAPIGLSWPHFEQRIVSLTVNPIQVSQQPGVSGMGTGRFATP
jgi:hypothetical protein